MIGTAEHVFSVLELEQHTSTAYHLATKTINIYYNVDNIIKMLTLYVTDAYTFFLKHIQIKRNFLNKMDNGRVTSTSICWV